MRRSGLLVGFCAAIVGCSSRDAGAGASLRTATVAAVEDTVGCGLVPVIAHTEPETLVREFVQFDSAGAFTRANPWFNGAVDCPGHEPAPDQPMMVRSYRLRTLQADSTRYRAEVQWERLAYGDALDPGVSVETLTVRRTPFGWRIQSPALNPKIPVPPPPSSVGSKSPAA
ncbi:MAG: hypothetical protein JO157_11620 [Acetobacteraceae bacterium]|nr:hypothetical protein [Acetobacteraceae bacterium]